MILFLYLALFLAGCDWVVVWRGWQRLEYFFKPAVLVALIVWFAGTAGIHGQAAWFLLGLVFSLAGDVLLMLPARVFMAGLAAFLLAHLLYASGFNPTLPPISVGTVVVVVLVGIAAVLLYRRISAAVSTRKDGGTLRGGILAYSVAISLMVISAMTTLFRPEWDLRAAALAGTGSLLFMASDSMLAIDRFVNPLRNGKLLVHITYHLGQIALMLGVALHLLND